MKKKNKILTIALGILLLFAFVATGCSKDGQEETTTDTTEETEESNVLPEVPYGIKISSITDDGIEVYWKKPEFADGYEIYRSYEKEGEYEFIDDEKKTVGTYKDNQFDTTKRKVYYKVRSYLYDGEGQKIYSDYTKIVTARYREEMVLSNTTLYIPSGVERNIKAYFGWGNAKNLAWTSDNKDIAVVAEDGTVTAVSAGTCTISCNSSELDTILTCQVTVDREPLEPLAEITADYTQQEDGTWKNTDAADTGDAVIMMTGDMMCTSAQQRRQDGGTGDYNFNESFDYIQELINSSDYAIGNLETTLSSSWPYMRDETYIENKPNCNAPSRYLDALKYAGFDAFAMSNNHNCDGGEVAALETNEAVDTYQFARTGLFSTAEEQRYILADINGIKVAFLSYSVFPNPGFNGKHTTWSQESMDTILNIYSKEKAEKEVKEARAAGAEFIITYVHWGVKNVFEITKSQKKTAQELADVGVDYIVGGHSHLVQPYEELTSADGKKVPCFYSLGDFHSSINQIPGNRDSIVVRIHLKRNILGKVILEENGYIPCYTFTNYRGKSYVTMPLDPGFNGGIELKKYEKFHSRIVSEVGDGISEYLPSEK